MIVDSVLTNAKAYVDGRMVECSIAVDNGRISKIGKEATMPKADKKINLNNLIVLPGLIDAHVHLRDEGKAYKEDFFTGTAAAASGGITTVLDMPNNDPVTMSTETLKNRMEIAKNRIFVDVGFYSEFPRNPKEIQEIVRAGAIGFKLFLADQIGALDIRDDEALLNAFKTVSSLNALTAVHAEDHDDIKSAVNRLKLESRADLNAFLEAHSENVEIKSVNRLIHIAKSANVHLHFCHLSTMKSLQAVENAKKSGLHMTCEVTPHHLFLSSDELKRIGTHALTMPPVRDRTQTLELQEGARSGLVDIIASDHAPHTVREKENKNVWDAKVGVPGLETTLPLLLTKVSQGQLSIGDVARLMSENPAHIFRLDNLGRLKKGSTANLTVIDLKRKHKIVASEFHSKAKYSPFDGWEVQGKPVKTFVNGLLIMDEGEIVAKAGTGRVIRGE